jgi:hypothetical protein
LSSRCEYGQAPRLQQHPSSLGFSIWRIGTDNRYTLVGLSEDPLAKAAEQAKFN